MQQGAQLRFADAEVVLSQCALCGDAADRCLDGGSAAVTTAKNPFQHAHVVAKAGPQEFAVVAFAEPVDVENLRQLHAGLFETEPVREIITEVVTAEGLHRHRVAAHHADRAGRSGRGFRGHRRAGQHAVGPTFGFQHQRHQRGTAATEDDGVDRHARRIIHGR